MRALKHLAKRSLYTLAGKIPWYPGYNEYRIFQIERILADKNLMASFHDGTTLAEGLGVGIDERIVEYPWLLSRLQAFECMLDAGGTLNHDWVLARPELQKSKVVIYTLAPESFVKNSQKVSYVYGDLRDTILRDDQFDAVACVSTIEHVGMDNTVFYTSDKCFEEQRRGDYLKVVDEIRRILRPGGKAFITVPFGTVQDHGWFQQFTEEMIQSLCGRFHPTTQLIRYYKYSSTGWQISTADACNDCVYFDFHREGRKRNGDNAAAARAVACLELTK